MVRQLRRWRMWGGRAALCVTFVCAFGCGEGGGGGNSDAGRDAATSAGSDAAVLGDAVPGPDAPRTDESEASPAEPTGSPNRIDAFELAILTTDALSAPFEQLARWKRARGLATRVVTVESLVTSEAGRDDPERIRNAVSRWYRDAGLRWLLLGGDTPLVPHRSVPCEAYNVAEDAHLDDVVATDLYYADLDGTWDDDGDGRFAERTDGVALQPDLAVGRVPARTVAEAQRYVDKVMRYERAARTDYQERAALLGEFAGAVDGMMFCSTLLLEQSIVGCFPDGWEVSRLYEEDCGDYPSAIDNDRAAQLAMWAAAPHVVVNFGHGSENTLGRLRSPDIPRLPNTERPAVYLTTECNSCEFDLNGTEHVACEQFVLAEGGGVLYVGNTEFGVGFPWEALYYQELLDAIYARPDATIGELFRDTLIGYADPALLDEPLSDLRWTQFTLILMGDPTLHVWTQRPIAAVVTKSERAVDAFAERRYEIRAAGQPVAGARVTLYAPQRFLYTTKTDARGAAAFRWPTAELPTGSYTLTVTGPTIAPIEETAPVDVL